MSAPVVTEPHRHPVGAAPAAAARRSQSAIDCGAALVLAMLAWPFPLARAVLPPAAHVVSVLIFWYAVQIAYFTVTMALWGATAGTRLLGLVVVTPEGLTPGRRQRVLWGALSGVTAFARVVVPTRTGGRGTPERVARVEVVALKPDAW